ncbi:hypothetical protein [Undibacterium luofuense]|uniref:Uncharacterized protein n=1 Tax=Undibacterium luofuense TaxID=2828733 RepID=A0A941I783_9BURK|nr:hypothetical protein [Undibacterium luofuense]MBR7782604.1 hypothetical protein [Undibacterium luofuense]
MNLKQKFVSAYLVIAGLFAIYSSSFGATSHKGFFYNLGGSLFWPAKLFPELGNVVSTIAIVSGVILLIMFGKK